ncbi:MAG: hypothetical protein ACRDO2_14255, partial [Nocardioidaceae bacterium]
RGEIGVGSELTRAYDGGLAIVTFRLDPPEDRRALEALLVEPDAEVLPVRWALNREATGELSPLTGEAREAAEQVWRGLVATLDRRRVPELWVVRRRKPDFDPAGPFGPLTPLVVARGAQLLHADADGLGRLVDAASKVDAGGGLRWPVSRARALARGKGRVAQLEAIERASDELVALVVGGTQWRRLVDDVFGDLLRGGRSEEFERAEQSLADLLRTATLVCLSTQAVADVADDDVLMAGTGAWESAQQAAGVAGLVPWHAAPHVVDVVRRLLRRRSAETLSKIGLMHDMTLRWGSVNEQTRRYADLEARLTGWALASPAACPPVLQLLEGTKAGQQLAHGVGPGLGGSRLDALQEWATCLTSALTHRQRLTAEDVRLFAWPLHSLLPGLERIVNEPL